MFKHVLLPTDGSPVSNKAAKAGIRFARSLGAKITGYYAVELAPSAIYSEGYIPDPETIDQLERSATQFGKRHLAAIEKLAKAAGVRFQGVCEKADTPWGGILRVARRKKCDAIFMASHGRSGILKLVMGSVTEKVLRNSKIPVIVYR